MKILDVVYIMPTARPPSDPGNRARACTGRLEAGDLDKLGFFMLKARFESSGLSLNGIIISSMRIPR